MLVPTPVELHGLLEKALRSCDGATQLVRCIVVSEHDTKTPIVKPYRTQAKLSTSYPHRVSSGKPNLWPLVYVWGIKVSLVQFARLYTKSQLISPVCVGPYPTITLTIT